MEERVQKILARAGYGSRRASEDLIISGRVRINGEVAVLGSKADPQHDTITIDNQPIARQQAPVYIAVNKPSGVLSEVSPEEPRDTVRDLVPVPGHMFIVGRLDLDSEGLILLTNDGDLANLLTHPRYGHEKEYRVLVGARPDSRQLDAWKHGVVLEDGYRTQPAQVRLESVAGKGAWLRVILREGRKRQIREMGKLTGLPVLRIQRIRIGSLLIGDLKPGQWRELRPEEVRALRVNKAYRDPERPSRRVSRREVPRDRGERRSEGLSRSEGPSQGEGPSRGEGRMRNERPARGEGRPTRREGPVRGGRASQSEGESERPSTRTRRPAQHDEGAKPVGAGSGRTGGAGRSGGAGRAGGAGRTGSASRPGGRATSRPGGRPDRSDQKPAGSRAPRRTPRGKP